ncbi:hypothetical protein DRQ17_05865 [bacterium]|nr:MAG: hypothetical protein DRQ17_05865 [bacterium]
MDSSTPIRRTEIFYVRGMESGMREGVMDFFYSPVVVGGLEVDFFLRGKERVVIGIYDLAGRKVREVRLGLLDKGYHRYKDGQGIKSGVYFFQIQAGEQRRTGRFVLITP